MAENDKRLGVGNKEELLRLEIRSIDDDAYDRFGSNDVHVAHKSLDCYLVASHVFNLYCADHGLDSREHTWSRVNLPDLPPFLGVVIDYRV